MPTPLESISKLCLLPELKLIQVLPPGFFICEKVSDAEVCPRCAHLCKSVYDHRWVEVRDAPIREKAITIKILKRRFWCKPCCKPFTEPVPGILPGRRTTQRFRLAVMEACRKYSDLSQVKREFKVSYEFIYSAYYERLKLNVAEKQDAPWPSAIGMDEHSYGKNKMTRQTQFVTTIVNHSKGKMFQAVMGKSQAELEVQLSHIPGRENVRWVTMDMCDPYRNFIRANFPHAKLIADVFHVLRLLTPALFKARKEVTGTRADARAKKLLLMSQINLRYPERLALQRFLQKHPKLHELYQWKERLHSFYRIKGYGRAYQAYKKMMDDMSVSFLPEIRTLRNTLLKWKEEILNYFQTGLTNARLEGFNCKASLLKRRAYGYRNPQNYLLQLLNACS